MGDINYEEIDEELRPLIKEKEKCELCNKKASPKSIYCLSHKIQIMASNDKKIGFIKSGYHRGNK